MDNTKDNNIKDSEKTNVDKPDLTTYVLLKAEKIVSAVYAVTAFLSDSEPLKWKLREASLSLLSELSFLRQRGGVYRGTMLDHAVNHLRSFVSLIDVGLVGGFVSEMNFRILRNECVGLINKIGEMANDNSLERSLMVDMPLLIAPPSLVPETSANLSYISHDLNLKDRKLFNPQSRNTNQSYVDNSPKVTNHNNTRREAIIKFVRGKGWTAIKDIAAAVPDCSVKTVQRELVTLVNDGLLKKQGDRRWSRYLMV
ncbi:MAG: hypothetical protein WCO03_01405 [bacterium]